MNTVLQLTHPEGKKAIRMSKDKYDVIKSAVIKCLKSNGACTHKNMYLFIVNEFELKKIKFEGNVEWHMEWVKLDLESKGIINRLKDKSHLMWELS